MIAQYNVNETSIFESSNARALLWPGIASLQVLLKIIVETHSSMSRVNFGPRFASYWLKRVKMHSV